MRMLRVFEEEAMVRMGWDGMGCKSWWMVKGSSNGGFQLRRDEKKSLATNEIMIETTHERRNPYARCDAVKPR